MMKCLVKWNQLVAWCAALALCVPCVFSPVASRLAADLGLAALLQGKTNPCVCSHDVNIGRKMISIIER